MTLLRAALAIPGLALAAAPAAFGACRLGQMAELPVTMQGLRPTVSVQINGADARLIADSGASYGMLTPGGAAQLKLKLEPAPDSLRGYGIGGEAALSLATVKDFMLAGIAQHNVQFIVGGSELGGELAGVLGQNVLGIADVEYDLADGVIRLMRPKGCAQHSLAYWAGSQPVSVIDIERTDALNPQTRATAYLNGSRIRVLFDTGATASMLTLHAAERAGAKADGPGVVPAGFSYGVGRELVRSWIAPFASFKLGGEEIRNTHLRIGDTTDTAGADMLIGADFFLSHRLYVSNEQRKLYFTYNGGTVFNLTTSKLGPAPGTPPAAAAAAAAEPPTDAASLSRRGMALAARRDFEPALADLTRACELAPQEAAYFYQRGLVRSRNGQPELALQDFDHALELDPDDLEAHMARASLRLGGADAAAAQADLDAADRLAATQADLRFQLGLDYARAGLLASAIAQFDLWIPTHPQDVKLGTAFEQRCRARALLGRELQQALHDCNAALRLNPKTAQFLDSRGLVRLRRGDYRKSISDYDAALRLQPTLAWALYGRGLDRWRLGSAAAAQADLAAATALQPQIAEQARQYGLAP